MTKTSASHTSSSNAGSPSRTPLTRSSGSHLLIALFAIQYPADGSDTSFRSMLQISKQQLHMMSIHPDHIRAGFYIQNNETPVSQQPEAWEDPKLPKLNAVRLHANGAESVWLRAQCTEKAGVSFDECHGSVCKAVVTLPAEKDADPNTAFLRGSMGDYTLFASQLQKTIATASGKQDVCRLSWPAWAVRAKSLNAGNRTELPKQLLVIQTDSELLWLDAARKTLWNRAHWPIARSGVFSSFEADEFGRMLFKNRSGAALMLDFKSGQAFAYSRQTLSKPDFALASVFARNEWNTSGASVLQPDGTQNMRLLDINLAGIWWNQGYLTWSNAARLSSTGKSLEPRRYPNDAVAASAAWSNTSGVAKTIVSFLSDSKLTLSSLEDDSEQFVLRHSVNDEATLQKAKSARIWADESTLALQDAQGSMNVIQSSGPRTAFVAQSSARVVQLGPDLFVAQPDSGKSTATCKLTHWRSRGQDGGWYTGLQSESGDCAAGFSRSNRSTSIVEKTTDGIRILFYGEH